MLSTESSSLQSLKSGFHLEFLPFVARFGASYQQKTKRASDYLLETTAKYQNKQQKA